jgi:assimilatory nitrate reductase catalytic subunit
VSSVRTTCPYCGVGCGVAVTGGVVTGDPAHPANFGRLCSKGAALKDTLALPDRLVSPSIGGRETNWDEALSLIAARFTDIVREHGPDAVAFYVSGQFLTEDYYVANKLMKGFIGSANIDTNSRLCMASSVAGHIRAFGEDIVPGCYEDLDETDLAVLVGSNTAWCHPVLYQRLIAAREKRGTKIVVIDPRRTPTCETADLHLPLAAGSDVLLFNGLLAYLSRAEALDRNWIAQHVSGFAETMAAAVVSAPTLDVTAAATGIAPADLLRFYELFAQTERVVTLYSQGVNQSVIGTDKVNAIVNCHLATGRMGRAGMGPFSLTGQPNAMGGREVGGLANQLAAHMTFEPTNVDRVSRFWNAPNIATRPGLKAVEMFKAVRDGRIKAIWIAATNPAASMPNASHVREALQHCPFVVVSDAWPTDTSAHAHVVLPAAAWAEKDGTVTNSERCISRQRAFRAPPGMARPDWWMFAEVARRMGWTKEFSYPNAASIFREHAALSAFENGGQRVFDIGALSACDDAAYDALEPVQWPCPKDCTQIASARLFAKGGFPTSDGRARMVPVSDLAGDDDVRSDFTLILNTGRIRDQWHTMTRTGRVPRLMTHVTEPQLAIHPGDAAMCGLTSNGFARVENARGSIVMRALVTEAQRRGEVFAPMHWTDQFSSAGAIGRLVHDKTDAISGQPGLKGSLVRVSAVSIRWSGLLLRRAPVRPELGDAVYWSKAPIESGFAFDLAGWTDLASVVRSEAILRRLLQITAEAELVSYSDPKKSVFRYAGLLGDHLEACLFLAPAGAELPSREGATRLLGRALDATERFSLLAAHTQDHAAAPDKIVCACFAVGGNSLATAIRNKNLKNVSEIGSSLQAGTNCGSCIPELKRLLKDALHERSAVNVVT